jgi:hypothetical protein
MTENENKALQLAKKVFEHFTKDALPFAREILALEHELGMNPVNGHSVNQSLTDFPVSDITAVVPENTVNKENIDYRRQEELVHDPVDDLPF